MTNGFVHIIESPSPLDLLDGRTEGRALSEAMRLAGIAHWYNLASDRETLRVALTQKLNEVRQASGKLPIIHLSAHGNAQGIGLTSGEFVSWQDLGDLLAPIHSSSPLGLLVCLSSCESFHGIQMAMVDVDHRPFWALVSNIGKPTWADACIGYIAFYHRFFKGHHPQLCVDAMKAASGDDGFCIEIGDAVKARWNSRFTKPPQDGSPPAVGSLGNIGLVNFVQ